MNIFAEIASSITGLWAVIGKREGAEAKFNLTPAGFITATWFYFIFLVIGILLQAVTFGISPSYWVIAAQLAVNFGPLIGLAITAAAAVTIGQSHSTILAVLVPGTYALTLALIASLLLSLVLPPASIVLLGVLAYVYFMIGQVIGKMGVLLAGIFALIATMMLVIVPFALSALLQILLRG